MRCANGGAVTPPGFRREVTARIAQLHDEATELFTGLDGAGPSGKTGGSAEGGGGGVSRALTEGMTFEKAGVNRSAGGRQLEPDLAQRIGAQAGTGRQRSS